MKKSVSVALLTSALLSASVVSSFAAEPIVGTWKRANGTLIKYSSAGGTKYCGKVLTGEYKNKSIGCMSGTGGSYVGEVKKLDEGKTYTGKAKVRGNTLKLAGCVLAGVICKSENLKRQ